MNFLGKLFYTIVAAAIVGVSLGGIIDNANQDGRSPAGQKYVARNMQEQQLGKNTKLISFSETNEETYSEKDRNWLDGLTEGLTGK